MIKDIPFKGISAVPSDYDCEDGSLDHAVNFIPENGALRPVLPPKTLFYFPEKYTLLGVHKVSGHDMLLFYTHDDDGHIFYGDKNELETDFNTNIKEVENVSIGGDCNIYDCAIIGNTVCLAGDGGLVYLLYRNNTYTFLGNKPPFVTLSFGMLKEERRGAYTEQDIVIHKQISPEKPAASTFGMESELASLTQQLYGMLLPYVNDNIAVKGMFYQPFFVRYAYRLYDGSHYWPSAPVLMLPTATVPLLKLGTVSSGDDSDHVKVKTTMLVDAYSLMCRSCGTASDANAPLSAWSDIVSGIDIFVSAPIYTYMQSKDLTTPWLSAKGLMQRAPFSKSTPISSTDSSGATTTDVQVTTLLGHYAESAAGSCIDHTYVSASDDATKYWNLVANEDFSEDIKNTCNFYLYKSISLDTASSLLYTPAKLTPDEPDLTNLVTRSTLKDSYQSHHTLMPHHLFAFNGRLNCADMRILIPQPFPLASVMERDYVQPEQDHHLDVDYAVAIRVYCRVRDQVYSRIHQGIKRTDDAAAGMDVLYNPSTNAPRYFFYPDANAFRADIECEYSDATGKEVHVRHVLPLKAHDYLNGAYYFEALAPGRVPQPVSSAVSAYGGEAEIGNMLYTSEVNNPFFVSPTDINTIGNGRILALSAAVKAMSQGQFGQFPLYVFSTDGVWAMQTNVQGSYSAISPVSRDVCSDPAAITQTDKEVLFPSARGLMCLSGSASECISDTIDNKSPYPATSNNLPSLDKLFALLHLSDADFTTVPFREFLVGARMVYDHAHQRVFLASASKHYAYVYSISDRRWGMAHSSLDYGVLSYPYSLAVGRAFARNNANVRALMDYSQYDNETSDQQCLLVSRPLKLGAPDVLKTISEAVVRGHFPANAVAVALYGSRNLNSWYLIWSSANNRLRGFSGTPYKYFRIAVYASLYADSSISGVSLDVSAKYNNRLR